MANLFISTINALRSFLAMTSSMMPVANNSIPAMTSMTAPMSVGKRATMPVCQKSMVTLVHNMMPITPRIVPKPPKNGSGLYSRIMRKIVLITLMPSPMVLSLLTDPAGRSRIELAFQTGADCCSTSGWSFQFRLRNRVKVLGKSWRM